MEIPDRGDAMQDTNLEELWTKFKDIIIKTVQQ